VNKLYLFCGIPFAGKTTLAKKVANRFGYTRIDLDEVKFELLGNDVNDETIDQSSWDRIYQEMYHRIDNALKRGETVIHDTGNFTIYERELVRKIGQKTGIEAITVFVDTPIEVAHQRLLENRQSNSRFDISDKSFESAVAEMEPPALDEKQIIFTDNSSVEKWIANNFGEKNRK